MRRWQVCAAGAGRFGFIFFEHEKLLTFAAQIILHFAVIARKVEKQNAFLRLENQLPIQTRAALVKPFVQLANGQAGMNVRLSKTVANELDCVQDFALASGVPDDFLEPLGQLNGNHRDSP